ncbi:hypothetical protein M409DRAFT_21685 [Zasmidium cellare ATCC 36951]|uniref:Uncharacterized protein n=1 Tax=Zasmidium cellare ATCC 36951 TaxID=1080233 RepID=A0A6A6CLZ0_ZASCE|nr:uncharacterized protein M409DRAFT_21685 [Zasmidium cellare ATCC 36951]KAF2168247.1 hypothetical protein M409DRAFT_21685 [Zasmidium cellare ATCC 36951]
MPLLELPVELQREIYSYVLCPGFITIRRTRFDCLQCQAFTRQRSGRTPQWNLTPNTSTHCSMVETAVCERLDKNMAAHLIQKATQTTSRYFGYQLKRVLLRHHQDRKMTIVDCSPQGLPASAVNRAKEHRWCACQYWPVYPDIHGLLQARHRCLRNMMIAQELQRDGSDARASDEELGLYRVDLSLLRVCREVYAVARDLVWEENMFHFEVQYDFETFLGMLSERQRSKLKKVQIVAEVLVMLG